MSNELQRVVTEFRSELHSRIAGFEARGNALSEAIKPYTTNVNTFCEALRAVAQQQYKSEFDFQRYVSAYDMQDDTVTITHVFHKNAAQMNVAVVFGRAGAWYDGAMFRYEDPERLYQAISSNVLTFYTPG